MAVQDNPTELRRERQPSHTILFAEDSEDDRLLFELGFEQARAPFELKFVDDGIAATEYLCGKGIYSDRARFPLPCVLLTDLKMPRMDGLELLSWVRSRKRWRDLPVILFTGSNRDEDRMLAMQRGATAYVVKELLMRPPASLFEALLRYVPQGAGRALSGRT